MTYKTLTLQLYRPGTRKRALMDQAFLHYSQALQFLTDRCREEIVRLALSGGRVTRLQLVGLVDKKMSEELNRFSVQPFKDSLKIEFASLAAAYIGQKRLSGSVGYPFTFLDVPRYESAVADCISRFDGGRLSSGNFRKECSRLISHAGKPHSIYFGRYSLDRDFCLLYDEVKDRFYTKLYLLNSEEGYGSGEPDGSSRLRYVAEGLPPAVNKGGKKRYIIVPLAFGREQHAALKGALEHPGLLHTARLVKRGGEYYLMVNMACSPGPELETATTMGVARNPSGGLDYAVCDRVGAVLNRGRVSAQGRGSQALYSLAKKIAGLALENRSQVVLEANGGKNDRAPAPDCGSARLSCGQYAQLDRILRYKLPEKGLPPPAEVSPNNLFLTCPDCQNRTSRNKITEELFVCVECGYASESEWIGCENLARRLIKYRRDKVPITVSRREESLLFCNSSLKFEYALPQDAGDYQPMYEALSRYTLSFDGKYQSDPKQYAVWRKLRQSPDIKEAVRLVFR